MAREAETRGGIDRVMDMAGVSRDMGLTEPLWPEAMAKARQYTVGDAVACGN
jgi:hypothetical protein